MVKICVQYFSGSSFNLKLITFAFFKTRFSNWFWRYKGMPTWQSDKYT